MNKTIVRNGQIVVALGDKRLHSVVLTSWHDYIENIAIKFKTSWVSVLKVAVDIF